MNMPAFHLCKSAKVLRLRGAPVIHPYDRVIGAGFPCEYELSEAYWSKILDIISAAPPTCSRIIVEVTIWQVTRNPYPKILRPCISVCQQVVREEMSQKIDWGRLQALLRRFPDLTDLTWMVPRASDNACSLSELQDMISQKLGGEREYRLHVVEQVVDVVQAA